MSQHSRRTLISVMVIAGAIALQAAPLNKALTDADGRRKAAENGLRQIKAKSSEEAQRVRDLYTDAMSRNNVWVDIVCQAIEQGTTSAPDVSAAAAPAATSLIAWVGGRNRVLGLPELTGETAESVRKLVVQNISDIADAAWRDNRSRDGEKRRKAAGALRDRLQWSTFEAVQ